jgi:hypothetical protein
VRRARRPEPFDLMSFCPASNAVMAAGWLGALSFALGRPEIVAAFREDTGNRWTPGRTPLDRIIDDAAGAGEGFMRAFLPWFNENVWGDENAEEQAEAPDAGR